MRRDDIQPEELARHVQAMHGVQAHFLKSIEVKETHEGRTVWEGAVKVFALTGHPSGAKLAYAWTFLKENGKRQVVAILGVSPVDDAASAVRTMILAQVRQAEKAKN